MNSETEIVSVLLIDEGSGATQPVIRVLSEAPEPRLEVQVVPSMAAAIDVLAVSSVDIVLLALRGELAAERVVALVAAAADDREIAHVERELARAVAELSDAQRIGRMGSWRADLDRGAWVWSPELFRLVGLAPSRDATAAPTLLEYVHPEDRERVEAALARARVGSPFELEARIIAADGAQRNLNVIGRPDPTHAGLVLGIAQDVTELRAVERALRGSRGELVAQRELLSGVLDHAPIGMAIAAPQGRFIRVNRALGEILGYVEWELLKLSFDDVIHPDDLNATRKAMRALLAGDLATLRAETRFRDRDGATIWGELSASLIQTQDGSPLHIIAQLADMTQRRRYEAELERLATHDPLTGLANHRLFHQRLGEEMATAVRHGRRLSVAILDLDHFKQINDRFGHVVGDHALIAVAERLTNVVREGELLARVGGEEFAWVLPDADAEGVFAAAERARLALSASELPPVGRLTISIGVATRDSLREASTLYERADAALYRAKHEGRDQTVSWDPSTSSVVRSAGADG
jgi:diguanylate cyclase (GGDEF)-like protein/PAS domain S-box-containing protein